MSRTWPALDLHFPEPCPPALVELVQVALLDAPPLALEEYPPPSLPPVAWSEDPPSVETPAPRRWRLVYDDAEGRDRARTILGAALAAHAIRIVSEDLPDEDWAARSQAHLMAVQVGRIVVCPPWDVPAAARGAAGGADTPHTAVRDPHLTVIIQPSMGFGTGHHATTRLCLQAMQATDLTSRSVLDVGTGSGVLALAAARLGAREVVGIDPDRDALANARENAALNDLRDVRFHQSDVRHDDAPEADIVLANLTGALLVAGAEILARSVRPGGHLIVSGFMEHEAPAVVGAFVPPLRVFRGFEEGGWMAILLDRPAGP